MAFCCRHDVLFLFDRPRYACVRGCIDFNMCVFVRAFFFGCVFLKGETVRVGVGNVIVFVGQGQETERRTRNDVVRALERFEKATLAHPLVESWAKVHGGQESKNGSYESNANTSQNNHPKSGSVVHRNIDLDVELVVGKVDAAVVGAVGKLKRGHTSKVAGGTNQTVLLEKGVENNGSVAHQVFSVEVVDPGLREVTLKVESVGHSSVDGTGQLSGLAYAHKGTRVLQQASITNSRCVETAGGHVANLDGLEVRPSRFVNLGAEIPKEGSVGVGEGFHLLDGQVVSDFLGSIEGGWSLGWEENPFGSGRGLGAGLVPVTVDGAQSVDGSRHTGTVGSLERHAGVDGSAGLCQSHVGSRTRNELAGKLGVSVEVVVETVQPHGAVVRGQRVLSNNDGTESLFHGSEATTPRASIGIKGRAGGGVEPSLVNVSVNGTAGTTDKEQ